MAEPPNPSASDASSLDVHLYAPPLAVGPQRVFYQYSVAIPQFHLILVSVLQGIVFGDLVFRVSSDKAVSVANAWKGVTLADPLTFAHPLLLYAPYILSSCILLMIWTNFVYASSVVIWPPTFSRAVLIFIIAVAEVFMVTQAPDLRTWAIGVSLVSLFAGYSRIRNYQLFPPAHFEEALREYGHAIMRREAIIGIILVGLSAPGLVLGIFYDGILTLIQVGPPQLGSDGSTDLLRWVWYGATLVVIFVYLLSERKYRNDFVKRILDGKIISEGRLVIKVGKNGTIWTEPIEARR